MGGGMNVRLLKDRCLAISAPHRPWTGERLGVELVSTSNVSRQAERGRVPTEIAALGSASVVRLVVCEDVLRECGSFLVVEHWRDIEVHVRIPLAEIAI